MCSLTLPTLNTLVILFQIIGCTVAMSTTLIAGLTIKCIAKHKLDFASFFFPPGAPIGLAPLLVPVETVSQFLTVLISVMQVSLLDLVLILAIVADRFRRADYKSIVKYIPIHSQCICRSRSSPEPSLSEFVWELT